MRDARGMTQQDLAELSHMDASTVGKIERGELRLKLEQLLALSRGLRTDIRELLEDAPERRIEVVGRLLRGGAITPLPTRRWIECPSSLDPSTTQAAEVQENALFPLPNGGLILFDRLGTTIAAEALGRLSVVRASPAAPLLVGQLRACPSPGIYSLWSTSGPLLEEVPIEAASPVRTWLDRALLRDSVPALSAPAQLSMPERAPLQAAEAPAEFGHIHRRQR